MVGIKSVHANGIDITDKMFSGTTYVEDTNPEKWQYYLRRGNSYYFRNGFAKMAIEIDDEKARKILKFGNYYMMKISYDNCATREEIDALMIKMENERAD